MARPKKAQTGTVATTTPVVSEERILKSLLHNLSGAGFHQHAELKQSEAGMSAAIAWGRHEGVETPRLLALVLPSGAWDRHASSDSVG